MKPKIRKDRFGPGWICSHFLTNTRGSGDTPVEAFVVWRGHVAAVLSQARPAINAPLLPKKETTHAQ